MGGLQYTIRTAANQSIEQERRLLGARKYASDNNIDFKFEAQLRALHEGGAVKTVDETSWSQDRLLIGKNGIAALTFCNVPLLDERKTKREQHACCGAVS